jgi:hypothetical protein
MATTTLTAHCLCKTHEYTAQIPTSSLPLLAHACHCTSCRHATGGFYTIGTTWPADRSSVDISSLKSYHFSDRVALRFCGTCSTPLFWQFLQDPDARLFVLLGTLRNDADVKVKLYRNIFVKDTRDGGASMWLRHPNADGSEAPRYAQQGGDEGDILPYEWPGAEMWTGYEKKLEDTLPIRCRCGGVDMRLHRGNYAGKKKEELPWFVDPVTHKLIGGFCMCDSCRLAAGVDIFHWTYAEMKNISFADGTRLPESVRKLKELVDGNEKVVGTLTYYTSREDVQRYFCSNCSACVFYAVADRPDVLDVAIGLLDASDGARAEGFLSWNFGGIGHAEDVKGGWREGLKTQVEKESERWRIERDYPKNWRRVAREEEEAKTGEKTEYPDDA